MSLRVRVEGLREVQRALAKVPADGRAALVRRSNELAYNLLRRMRTAAARDGRQARNAASTLKVVRGELLPTVVAGPHELLFGSEFGVTRHFGWYNRGRYYDSRPIQFRHPHRGSSSAWFFTTEERSRDATEAAWQQAADDVIRGWGA